MNDMGELVELFLDEARNAVTEHRTPSMIAVSGDEYDAIARYFGFTVIPSEDASKRTGSIAGVPLQVIECLP